MTAYHTAIDTGLLILRVTLGLTMAAHGYNKFFGKGGVKSASDIAAKLLSEAHVVVVPGEAFGTMEHIRLSYAVSHDVVDEGVKRMREYFATLG